MTCGRFRAARALSRSMCTSASSPSAPATFPPRSQGEQSRRTLHPGATNDREVIEKAVAGCDGVLTVLVPWGRHHYSAGTAQAVLDYARPGARLVFSCGWHITRDGKDVYPPSLKREEALVRLVTRLVPFIDLDDQVEAVGGSLPATHGGQSCAGATLRRARVRACPCGAGTWVIPSSAVYSGCGARAPAGRTTRPVANRVADSQ